MRSIRDACSAFILEGNDAIRVSGRTMDWYKNLDSNFVVVPRHQQVKSFYDGQGDGSIEEGMSWTTDYGYVGINLYDLPIIADGINEMGLSAAFLFLNNTEYPKPAVYKDHNRNISMIHLVQYILGKCQTVEDVKNELKTMTVCGLHVLDLKGNQGVHLIIHDAQGHNMVLEPEKGQIVQYLDESATVLANSPFLHWHLENRNNYCNITNQNVSHTVPWPAFGNGSGMLGLPGDSTPPSRFIRMSVFRQFSPLSKTVSEAVQQAFHIINRVTLVNGEVDDSANGSNDNDYTQWEVVRDHINKIYYYRTNQNQTIRAVELTKLDFSGQTKYEPLSLHTGHSYEDVTAQFKSKK